MDSRVRTPARSLQACWAFSLGSHLLPATSVRLLLMQPRSARFSVNFQTIPSWCHGKKHKLRFDELENLCKELLSGVNVTFDYLVKVQIEMKSTRSVCFYICTAPFIRNKVLFPGNLQTLKIVDLNLWTTFRPVCHKRDAQRIRALSEVAALFKGRRHERPRTYCFLNRPFSLPTCLFLRQVCKHLTCDSSFGCPSCGIVHIEVSSSEGNRRR